MPAPKGNQFWKLVKEKTGCPKIYENESQLWDAACEYFQWVEDNPLQEEKLFHFQGEVVSGTANKMRAMTLDGLCLYLKIDRKTFDNYGKSESHKEFFPVVTRIREVIREQKFTGAAAELLNPTIIARDLGLHDNHNVKQTSTNTNYNIPEGTNPKDAAQIYLDAINSKD